MELAISSQDFPRYYVARKLAEHGFVRADSLPGDADDEWITIEEMTATGHEFLETIRDPKAGQGNEGRGSKGRQLQPRCPRCRRKELHTSKDQAIHRLGRRALRARQLGDT